MSAPERARWLGFGNIANGFLVFGNVVTGFIAIGNVARGFIAIGNVAIGVFAFGNVALGVVSGVGATIALGAFAASGVLAVPALAGAAGVGNALEAGDALSIMPIIAWLVAARLAPGRRAVRAPAPELTRIEALVRGERSEGWVRARVERAGPGAIRLRHGGAALELPVTAEALPAGDALLPEGQAARLLVRVRAEEQLRGGEGGYRAGAVRERVLTCVELTAPPPWIPPWIDAGEVQWWLARAWKAGAAVVIVMWLAGRLLMRLLVG